MIGITGMGPVMDMMVMQSSADADRVIELFESAIMQGYHPNDIEQEVYRQAGVNPADFMQYDKEKIQRKVEAAYEAHFNQWG